MKDTEVKVEYLCEELPDWCRKYFDYADFGDDMIDSFYGSYRDGDRILILL